MNYKLHKEPILSVRLMTYNHEKFIHKAVDGILNQETDFPFEIVIGDDFSNDQTLQIISKINSSKKNILIRVLERKRGDKYDVKRIKLGRIYNFVNIIENCNGKYIALLDGDDFWQDNLKLQKQVDFLEKNKDYVTCYHDSLIIDEENTVLGPFYTSDEQKIDYSQKDLIEGRHTITCTRVFRNIIKEFPKEMYKANGGDTFLTSLLGHYGKGKFIREIKPAAYRVHSGGVFSKKSAFEQIDSMAGTRLQLYKYYKTLKEHKEYKLFYKNKYLGQAKNAHYNACIEKRKKDSFYYFLNLLKYGGLSKFQAEFITIVKGQIKCWLSK